MLQLQERNFQIIRQISKGFGNFASNHLLIYTQNTVIFETLLEIFVIFVIFGNL